MCLHKDVRDFVRQYTEELYILLEFTRDYDRYIIGPFNKRITDDTARIPEDIKGEMRQMSSELPSEAETDKELEEMTQGYYDLVTREADNLNNYSTDSVEKLVNLFFQFEKSLLYPNLLYSIALTHIIAVFRRFLSDFLSVFYVNNLDLLKPLEGNIDDVAEKIKKDFNLDVSQFNQFETIREASNRRNIVIHNRSITDEHYCGKIMGAQIGVKLSTDFKYIETLINAIGRFIDHLDAHFSREMHYTRYPGQNRILHPPATNT